MAKIAYVFPGQGSQQVGMGKDIVERFDSAKDIFEQADDALGYKLSTLIFDGPEEELKLTYHTQPAILTASTALYEVFRINAPKAAYMAGHSLGEYSAIVAAQALPFQDAVRTVSKRGQYMDEAVPAGQGAMAAVMGGDRELIDQICTEISMNGYAVQMANLNCPGQIVISGTKEGVEQAGTALKEAGVKRVIPLVVSGPFHSDLMKPAASRLAHVLERLEFQTAKVPIVTNVDARPVMLGEDIEHALIEQVFSPVLWEDSIRWMMEQGVDCFVEIGPGKVLAGLIKKIRRDVRVLNVFDAQSLEETLNQLNGAITES